MLYRDRLLTCPRCGDLLERSRRHESWRCGGCGGVAVDSGELVRILLRYAPGSLERGGLRGLPTRAVAAPRGVGCAACGVPMRPLQLHGVRLDRCDHDRLVWFDTHQLDFVIDATIAEHEARKGWGRRLRDLLFAN